MRHRLPRWEHYLQKRGVTVIPSSNAYWTEEEDRAHTELFLLLMQAGNATPRWIAHQQRNLTGVRPYKP